MAFKDVQQQEKYYSNALGSCQNHFNFFVILSLKSYCFLDRLILYQVTLLVDGLALYLLPFIGTFSSYLFPHPTGTEYSCQGYLAETIHSVPCQLHC